MQHLCSRPLNITRRACCQLLALLNDSSQISPCTPAMWTDDTNGTLILQYNPPSYLPDPEEIREDHVTFLLGILVLMLIALTCTFALSRMTRPKIKSYARKPLFAIRALGMLCRLHNSSIEMRMEFLWIAVDYGSLSNYGMFMWMQSSTSRGNSHRGASSRRRSSSIFVLLREMACRREDSHRNTSSLSILSQMDMSLLPSYQTATATPSSAASLPPPPYFAMASRTARGYQADGGELGIPLTALTSPAQSFHSYAYTEPPPEMTRSC